MGKTRLVKGISFFFSLLFLLTFIPFGMLSAKTVEIKMYEGPDLPKGAFAYLEYYFSAESKNRIGPPQAAFQGGMKLGNENGPFRILKAINGTKIEDAYDNPVRFLLKPGLQVLSVDFDEYARYRIIYDPYGEGKPQKLEGLESNHTLKFEAIAGKGYRIVALPLAGVEMYGVQYYRHFISLGIMENKDYDKPSENLRTHLPCEFKPVPSEGNSINLYAGEKLPADKVAFLMTNDPSLKIKEIFGTTVEGQQIVSHALIISGFSACLKPGQYTIKGSFVSSDIYAGIAIATSDASVQLNAEPGNVYKARVKKQKDLTWSIVLQKDN